MLNTICSFYQKKQRGLFRISRCTEIIDSTSHAARFFRKIWNKDLLQEQEQVYAIFVNYDYTPIIWPCLHIGGVSQTIIDVEVVITHALKCKAKGLFIAHSHTNGSLELTDEDIEMNNILIDACNIFNKELLDHIILTKDSYFSFREKGLIT